jgi:polysaccharide transporter, PST family
MILRIAKNNGLLVGQYAMSSLVPLLLVPHIVRGIGLAEYGRIAFILALAGYGVVFVQYSFQLTGPARIMERTSEPLIRQTFCEITATKLFLLLIALIVEAGMLFIMSSREHPLYYESILMMSVTIGAAAQAIWFLQSVNRFNAVFLISAIATSIVLAVGLTFINPNGSASKHWTIVALSTGPLVVGIGTLAIAFCHIGMSWTNTNLRRIFSIIREDSGLFVSQLIGYMYSGSGIIVIKILLGSEQAGIYSVMDRVLTAFVAASLLTHTAAYPILSNTYSIDRKKYKSLLKNVILIYLSATSCISAISIIFSNEITIYLFGGNDYAYQKLLYFALIWLNIAVFGPMLTGYMAVSGKKGNVLVITLMALAISFIVGIPFTLIFGPSGWLVGIIMSQSVVAMTAIKYWRTELDK